MRWLAFTVFAMTFTRIATAVALTTIATAAVGMPVSASADTTLPGGALSDQLTSTNTPGPSGELTGKYAGLGYGYTEVIPDSNNVLQTAGQIKLSIEGQTVNVYCIQFGVPLNTKDKYTSTSWAASNVPGLSKAMDIVRNHEEMGTALADVRAESAAVQLAVWTQTSGVDLAKVDNAGIRNRVTAILADAEGEDEPIWRAQLSAAASPAGTGKANVVSTVASNEGPLEGIPVVVKAGTAAVDGTTGTDGQVSVQVQAPTTGTAPANAGAQISFEEGVVMKPDTSGQMVMVADPVLADRNKDLTLTSGATPTPTTSPAAPADPTPSPTTVPAADPQSPTAQTPEVLPHTGSTIAPWMGWAALLAALAGAGVFTWSRMRASDKK